MVLRRNSFIFIIFLLSLFGILYYFRELVITAFVSYVSGPMEAIVSETKINATLSVSTDKDMGAGQYYCPGETVNITNTIKNTGNRNILGNLYTDILNPSSSIINTTSWMGVSLSPGQTELLNTTYLVPADPETGTYTTSSNFTYSGRVEYASDTFRISKGIGNFLVLPSSISQAIPAGNFSDTEKITFYLQYACENATVTFDITPGPPGNWTTLIPQEVFLLYTGAGNTTTVNISVPQMANIGIYQGTISVYANGDWQRDISLTVTVTEAAFSLNVTIPSEKKQVCPGEEIPAIIDITKRFSGVVDINMTYQIRNLTNYVLDDMNETLQLNESLQRMPVLTAPSSTGMYTFFSILQHNSTVVNAYDTFEVVQCLPPPRPPYGPSIPVPPTPSPVYEITLRLSTNILTVIRGNKTSFIAYLNNTGTSTVDDMKLSIEGIPLAWIEVLPTQVDIPAGQTREFLAIINIPEDAETGIRRLLVKAKDDVESNTEILTLVIGENPKEIADLLLRELELVRAAANKSLLVEECIEIGLIKSYYQDAEFARGRGLEEYNLGKFEESVNWFEYAIPIYIKVVNYVDITLEVEIERLKTIKLSTPWESDSETHYELAKKYLREKNYENICKPIMEMRTVVMTSFIFWPALLIILVVVVIIVIILNRKKKRLEREMILERVKKRLEITPPSRPHLYPKYTAIGRIKRLWKREEEKPSE